MPDRLPGDGIDADLLDRYLAHECTETEDAIVRRHLMARPDLAMALASFLTDLEEERSRPAPPDARESWMRLRGRMRETESDLLAVPGASSRGRRVAGTKGRHLFALLPSRRNGSGWRVMIAMVAAGLVVVAVFRVAGKDTASAESRPPEETFATANRERAELRLSDGTRIRLAPASHIRVAADYGEKERSVYLEGQGYFEVKHDESRPFIVHAGTAIARDLGTDFAVRSYPEDRAVQVVVRTGAVALSGVGRIGAGDIGRLGIDGTSSVTHGVAVDALLGWLDGRLVFHDAPLVTVIDELRRWHDADVQLADPRLGTLPFTGVLADVSFRSSIDLVAATLGLRVRRAGERVTLERIGGLTPSSHSPAAARRAR